MQFTQRQRPSWGRWRPVLAAIPVGLLLGFLGPFGSYPAYTTATRYAFWLGLTAAGVMSAIAAEIVLPRTRLRAGLIRIKRDGDRLAFAAPPLLRSGDVDRETLKRLAKGLRIDEAAIKASQWIDNGPGWVGLMLGSRAEVLALKPDYPALGDLKPGVVAPWSASDGSDAQFEVRAFIPTRASEDPVTGSLNAGLAQWLTAARLAPNSYIASQGTVLGRAGRVDVQRDGDDVWIGGKVVTCVTGKIDLG